MKKMLSKKLFLIFFPMFVVCVSLKSINEFEQVTIDSSQGIDIHKGNDGETIFSAYCGEDPQKSIQTIWCAFDQEGKLARAILDIIRFPRASDDPQGVLNAMTMKYPQIEEEYRRRFNKPLEIICSESPIR